MKTHSLLNRTIIKDKDFTKSKLVGNHASPSRTPNAQNHATHRTQAPNGANVPARQPNRQKPQNNSDFVRYDTNGKPSPAYFYANYGLTLKGKQTNFKCVFHSDKTPSLSINADTGAFYCFGCGASGGDVLDFYQLYHNCDFLTACKELGLDHER